MRSPTKLARLFLSSLGAEVLLASTLGLVLVSLGTSLSLATLLVVNVGVTFFAALIPVPGGIGVTEGALVVGLNAAGLDQATAFAAAICYRLCTYYLPPIWGWFAFPAPGEDRVALSPRALGPGLKFGPGACPGHLPSSDGDRAG